MAIFSYRVEEGKPTDYCIAQESKYKYGQSEKTKEKIVALTLLEYWTVGVLSGSKLTFKNKLPSQNFARRKGRVSFLLADVTLNSLNNSGISLNQGREWYTRTIHTLHAYHPDNTRCHAQFLINILSSVRSISMMLIAARA